MVAIAVFCASSTTIEQRWLDLAHHAGVEIGRRGHTLVSGGGCVGMMGSLAAGARAAGAHTIGVIPQALVDLEVADHGADELVVTEDMGERKAVLIDRADGFLTLPGGLGTLDELFEVWTTGALAMHHKPVVVLDVDGFYAGLLDWLRGLAERRFVTNEALRMLTVADNLGPALTAIEEGATRWTR